MCGITGIYQPFNNSRDLDIPQIIHDMTATLAHRGPDSGDVWVDQSAGIGVGHRRLAVVDLSPSGQQPMVSGSERYIIVYNGEVYNAEELKEEIVNETGKQFRGTSDTEVVLEAVELWGLQKTLSRLIGMFAFAMWDRAERSLIIARDRLGIKPLYWSLHKGTFLFSSELKAFRKYPHFDTTINQLAVSLYLQQNTVPAPNTIYTHANKLRAGSYLEITPDANIKSTNYWSLDNYINTEKYKQSAVDEHDAQYELDSLLSDAVARRMVADVPLGAFLSGGIDSSLVTALMQSNSHRPIKTFSVGFDAGGYNEAEYAKKVAQHIGTDHTELYVTSNEAMDIIPELPGIYDEPFADASQIPTVLISKLTRQHVTVALSGDGGDELFAGYNRYIQAHTLMQKLWHLPVSFRKVIAKALSAVPVIYWDRLISNLPVLYKMSLPGEKIHKFAQVLPTSIESYYPNLISHQYGNGFFSNEVNNAVSSHWTYSAEILSDLIERMQYSDILGYMQDDILTKVDRASMAYSLEVRVPIIDHRVVEFSWRLPEDYKLRNGKGKWILRQLLYKYVPKELIERPKMGFAVPLDSWLRGPLRDWAEGLLSEKTINEAGFINHDVVERRWKEHLSGKRNWQYLIWNILMLHSWHREWA